MYFIYTCISTRGTYVLRGIKKTIAQLTSLEHQINTIPSQYTKMPLYFIITTYTCISHYAMIVLYTEIYKCISSTRKKKPDWQDGPAGRFKKYKSVFDFFPVKIC